MRRQLSRSEVELLTEIVRCRAPDSSLIESLGSEQVSDEDSRSLGGLVAHELAQSGFNVHYDPTDRGRRLEDISDALTPA
jgi:hypothetical protein